MGLPLSLVEFSSHRCFYKLSHSWLLGGCLCGSCLLWPIVYLQFTWEVGLPPSPVEFSSHCHFYKLSCSWLLGVCCHSCLLWPACLFTVLWGISLPPSLVLRVPRPLCCMSFLLLLLIIQFFLFFPWVGVGLSRGLFWSDPRLSVGVPHVALLTLWSASSQVVWALVSGSVGALLASPFNVKWRCYVQAVGVEESKFCLFSVVFPVMCISSISPRFYFRRHAFCFLPLVAILESPYIYYW
jgi:hypothetical protein